MLGDLETKVHQAEGQGPARNIGEQLAALSSKFTTAGELTVQRIDWLVLPRVGFMSKFLHVKLVLIEGSGQLIGHCVGGAIYER